MRTPLSSHLQALTEASWIPYTDEKAEITSCGTPQSYDASKEFANKKVILFSVPGIFSSIIVGGDGMHKPKTLWADFLRCIHTQLFRAPSAWLHPEAVGNQVQRCGYRRCYRVQ